VLGFACLLPPLSSVGALIARTITPFPHPPHRTQRAYLRHWALVQDTKPSSTESHPQSSKPWQESVSPSLNTAWPRNWHNCQYHFLSDVGFPDCPGTSFTSACDTFRSSCKLMEFIELPQSPILRYFEYRSWTKAPSLHRHYPVSAVVRASPPPQYAQPSRHRQLVDRYVRSHNGASRVACVFLVYMLPPLPRRSALGACHCSLPQTYQPSPCGLTGRPAHCPFRGLLSVHSRCGLHTRQVT